jgi:hypothetical protein
MKIEIKGELRILTAENGYLTQNTDSVIDNRIFVKQKMMLPTESESNYKEVERNKEQQTEQPTLEQRVADIEQITEGVITILNDKGIAP